MAGGNTASSDISSVIPTILSPARDVVEKPTFMTEMVTTVTLKDGDGSTYNWPKFGTTLSAQSLTEGTPINNPQKLVPSSQQFTVSEVGLEVILTDKAIRYTPEPMKARSGRFMGNAMKRKLEQDLLAVGSTFTRDLGSGGSSFNPAWISVSNVRLGTASGTGADANATEPAPRPYAAILHPFGYHDILTSGATLGSNINSTTGYFPIQGLTEQLIREYDVQMLYDIAMAKNPLISISSNNAVSFICSKEAMLLVKTSVMLRQETDRDINLRAWDMVITSEYGTGKIEDQWGFISTHDATPPTS